MSFGAYLDQFIRAVTSIHGFVAVVLGFIWGFSAALAVIGTADPHHAFEVDINSGSVMRGADSILSIAVGVTLMLPIALLIVAVVDPLLPNGRHIQSVGGFFRNIGVPHFGLYLGYVISLSLIVIWDKWWIKQEWDSTMKKLSSLLYITFMISLPGFAMLESWIIDEGILSVMNVGESDTLYSTFEMWYSLGYSFVAYSILFDTNYDQMTFVSFGAIFGQSKHGHNENFDRRVFGSMSILVFLIPTFALYSRFDVNVHGPLFFLGAVSSFLVFGSTLVHKKREWKRDHPEKEAQTIKKRLERIDARGEVGEEYLREVRTVLDETIEPALDTEDYEKAYRNAKRLQKALDSRQAYLKATKTRDAISEAEVLGPVPEELNEVVERTAEKVSSDRFREFPETAADALGIALEVAPDQANRAIEQAHEAINEKRPDDSSPKEPDDIDQIDEHQFTWIDDVDDESTAADLETAVEKLTEAVEARDEEDYAKAIRLADEAYLATEPTLEYLLDEAKREASDAEAAFESNEFDAAIEHWHSAEDRYERAVELANARDETEMATSVEDALANVRSNVENARTKRANARMVDLSEAANEATARGNELFEAGDYEDAMESYRTGAERYADAADVAAEHGFDDEQHLRTASERARTSVEDCKLARGERMVEEGADHIDDDPDEAVDALDDAIAYLERLDFERDELDTLLNEARRWHVEASTAVGRELMEEAEDLYDDEERHAAKGRFEDAKDHLREVVDDAIEHGFTDERSTVSDLVDACIENARLISEELTEVGAVEPDLENVEDVTDATTDYSPTDRLRQPRRSGPGVEDLVRAELPDHEVLEPIGGGGNADVHKVRLAGTGAVRALKRPRWHDTLSEEVTADFVAEAETWTNVDDHDGVVTVHDWGSVPEPWILMEFVEGGNLRTLVGEVDPGRAVDLLTDCCNALGHAHHRGIAHMDVKPGNLLLTDDGAVKIGDWGLARIVVQHTSGREGLTTPYAAPEQIEPAEYGSPDTNTDIYQLGVVAYELLTGRVPFDHGSQSATMRAILEQEPTPPSEVDSDVPAVFDDPLLDALAKHREDRHESILLFRNSLQAALQAV